MTFQEMNNVGLRKLKKIPTASVTVANLSFGKMKDKNDCTTSSYKYFFMDMNMIAILSDVHHIV